MNNFLDGFEKDSYNKPKKAEPTLEKFEVKKEEKYIEHETEVDYSYIAKKKRNRIILIILGILLLIATIITFIIINTVKVKDLVGLDLSEAKSWANKNSIDLKIEYGFDLEHDENVVFEQNIEENKKVSKGTTITIKVSKGTDPDEIIKIPDLKKMKLIDIEDWINKNKLSNVKIVKNYSNEITKDQVIDYKTIDDIDINNYKRKNTLTINISKGVETFEKNIEVKDFINKMQGEVDEWAKNNGITVIYRESDSNTVPQGMIISQSALPGSKIAKNDQFIITISTGKTIVVPNFYNINKNDAQNYTDLNIKIIEKYNMEVGFGYLINQSVRAGTRIKEGSNNITLEYSLGRPYIDDLTGTSEKDLPSYFFDFQAKGANISYATKYVQANGEKKGTIKSASITNQYVSLNTVVYFEIYQ